MALQNCNYQLTTPMKMKANRITRRFVTNIPRLATLYSQQIFAIFFAPHFPNPFPNFLALSAAGSDQIKLGPFSSSSTFGTFPKGSWTSATHRGPSEHHAERLLRSVQRETGSYFRNVRPHLSGSAATAEPLGRGRPLSVKNTAAGLSVHPVAALLYLQCTAALLPSICLKCFLAPDRISQRPKADTVATSCRMLEPFSASKVFHVCIIVHLKAHVPIFPCPAHLSDRLRSPGWRWCRRCRPQRLPPGPHQGPRHHLGRYV